MKIEKIFIDENRTLFYRFYDKDSEISLSDSFLSDRDSVRLSKVSSPTRRREVFETLALFSDIFPSDQLLYTEKGAPYLSSQSVNISISHTNYMVAILVSNKMCGVDIEGMDRSFVKVAHRYLPEMFEGVEALDKEAKAGVVTEKFSQRELAAAWTAKEAVFKAFGGEDIDIFNDIKILEICDSRVVCCVKGEKLEVEILLIQTTIFAVVVR